MTTEKQIEKIAKDICGFSCRREICIIDDKKCNMACTYARIAEKIAAKGYRKASDGAEEIFAEIIEALVEERIVEERKANSALEAQDTASYEVYNYAEDKLGTLVIALSLYKKKYTEDKRWEEN